MSVDNYFEVIWEVTLGSVLVRHIHRLHGSDFWMIENQDLFFGPMFRRLFRLIFLFHSSVLGTGLFI